MNSEELELSLRSEFENYLKAVVAEMQKESTEFQSMIEAEVERHKSQLDEAFRSFNARFESDHQFDEAFRSLVAEHLNLARDEGSKIAAEAMAEAEKLSQPAETTTTVVEVNKFDGLRDAIADISSKDSQSSILKSLVQHAADYAPRGAFFIIKNEHFVGWKVFGTDDDGAENAVREIHFSTASDSILGRAVRSLKAEQGSAGQDDSLFLDPLSFGQPEQMLSVPLVARGRGVAVLYADGENVNKDALEVLVCVAGMTVELRASSPAAQVEEAPAFLDAGPGVEPTMSETAEVDAPADEAPGFSFSESVSYEGGFSPETVTPDTSSSFEPAPAYQTEAPVESSPFSEPVTEAVEHYDEPAETATPAFDSSSFAPAPETQIQTPQPAVQFDEGRPADYSDFQTSQFETPSEQFAPAVVSVGGMEPAVDAVVETAVLTPSVPKSRLSDRNVDLPIEVAEDERRSHNDARRFARLLVSEIKLYNEKKVSEGRESSDLYSRLQEAIDRSREMYDKRVQPPVAAKFDYFHYELVNSLADGDAARLGTGYPGASV